MDRKNFIRASSALALGAGLPAFAVGASPARRRVAPSDRIRIAAVGVNGMGWSDVTGMLKHPQAELVALCDVDQRVLDRRVADLAKQQINVDTYGDHRKVLDRKDVDAVIIATPDHWHCMIMTDACAAGKDVYVEKPAGNSIAECARMVEFAQHYGRVVQVGQWQRSQKHFGDAVDFVHSGKLGKIRLVKAWAYMGWMHSIPVKPDGSAPPGVDYTRWLGPATMRPFNENRFHFNFRWFFDYAGGLMTDWGVHLIDYALMGMNAELPQSVMAAGGKFAYPNDAEEWPDTLTTVYTFGDYNMEWEHAIGISGGPYNRDHGIAYIGNMGTLVLDRGGWEVIPEVDDGKPKMEAVPRQKVVDDGVTLNTGNFLDVVASRKVEDLHAPIQAGAHVATVCQMGDIAYRTGKRLFWDAGKNTFTDDEANGYMAAKYHNGYSMPNI